MRSSNPGRVEEKILKYLTRSNSLDREFLKNLQQVKSQINNMTTENQSVLIGKILIEKACRMNNIVVKDKTVTTEENIRKSLKQYALDKILSIIVKISR